MYIQLVVLIIKFNVLHPRDIILILKARSNWIKEGFDWWHPRRCSKVAVASSALKVTGYCNGIILLCCITYDPGHFVVVNILYFQQYHTVL